MVGRDGVIGGDVDEVEQHRAALEVAEEAVTEARALAGAGYEAGNVGEHEARAGDLHHAEVGVHGGEGIGGDLRPGRGDGGEERRFAGVGEADEAGIGDELQSQPYPALLARRAGIGVTGRPVGRGLEMLVAEAAVAAAGKANAVAYLHQIGDQGLVVLFIELGAGRDVQHHVGGIRAGPALAHAVAAGRGLEVLLVAVVDERVEAVDRFRPHIAAAAAIAAGRAPELDELLAPKTHRAGAAVARTQIDLGLVEELHDGRS